MENSVYITIFLFMYPLYLEYSRNKKTNMYILPLIVFQSLASVSYVFSRVVSYAEIFRVASLMLLVFSLVFAVGYLVSSSKLSYWWPEPGVTVREKLVMLISVVGIIACIVVPVLKMVGIV